MRRTGYHLESSNPGRDTAAFSTLLADARCQSFCNSINVLFCAEANCVKRSQHGQATSKSKCLDFTVFLKMARPYESFLLLSFNNVCQGLVPARRRCKEFY